MTDQIEFSVFDDFNAQIVEMEDLLSQSKRAFIFGAGCSKSAGLPLMEELTEIVLAELPAAEKPHKIVGAIKKNFAKAIKLNIEDVMSELVDWISIVKRRESKSGENNNITIGDEEYSAENLEETLRAIKSSICKYITDKKVDLNIHRSFVRSIHSKLQMGKSTQTYEENYFILNYDTLFEDALGIEKIHFVDGFSGGATGWWSAENYHQNVQTRIFKVHGSIDWCLWKDDIFPRRVRPGISNENSGDPVLIWPAATKYLEAQRDPFAQIIKMLRESLRPGPRSEVILFVCGYSFGDDHINTEIERALQESEGQLNILVFTSMDEPSGILKNWLENEKIQNQIKVYANKGFFHGAKEIRSPNDLTWWKFEVIEKLIGGLR